ncbi:RHS repeat-associated core domain-containing protein, partial [Streptomyces sp. NPDC012769]|uniref:RHS repeat-associated core domain-containing protein n=1 Tax=Streptomyces sp. NPDC012769 TaxID=3364848 RepID=UPI0036D005CE
ATPSVGYQSGWTDSSTGEVNMAARWYQPGTGGFTSRDTWQLDPNPSVQANRYTYGNASPMNGIDPSGHSVLDCFNPSFSRSKLGIFGFAGKITLSPFCVGWETWISGHDSGGAHGSGHGCNGSAMERQRCADVRRQLNPDVTPYKPRNDCMLMPWQAKCKGGGGSTSSPTSPRGNNNYSGGGRNRGGTSTLTRPKRPTAPPKPKVPQNPYNGKNPPPAPKHIPKPDWNPSTAIWTATKGVDMVVSGANLLAMLAGGASEVFSPDQAPDTHDAPGADPGPGTGQDDEPRDCKAGSEGWREYGDVDTANGSRATGVEACLTKKWIEENPGTKTDPSVRPPGYKWAYRYAKFLGNHEATHMWRNACHLQAKSLGGSGTDLRNLSTCSRAANADANAPGDPGKPVHMATYEDMVAKAVNEQGQVVHYRVTPHYEGPRTVPTSYRMQATGYKPDGSPGVTFDVTIQNEMYSLNDGKWRNIGRVTDPRVRGPVPFGPGD